MRSSYTITATNTLGSSSTKINLAAFFYSDRNSDTMCGWNATGNFLCWGGNSSGELGDGTNTSRMNAAVTTAAATQGANVIVQSTGNFAASTCALTSLGAVYCTGDNGLYDLGNGGTSPSQTFIQTISTPTIVQLKNSYRGYCALTSTGGVYCWGTQWGANYEFGPSTESVYATPTNIAQLSGMANIAGGDRLACAITTSGALSCWGAIWSDTGLGAPSWSSGSSPITLTGFANPIQMSSSGQSVLVLNAAGQVAGFGDNPFYQLASSGGDQVSPTLTTIPTLSSVVQVCTTGLGYGVQSGSACALFGNGSVSCWGSNNNGQLGQGTTGSPVSTPTSVSAITNAVALFGTGSSNSGGGFCALLGTGSYVCWGNVYWGFTTPSITTVSGLP
jgi:alpha-tubulin suppressor-like RCC1 family protein